MSEFLAIAGLSGAGRSQAADVLEDLGWFVIDNLPPTLIDKVADLAASPAEGFDKVALVVGSGPHHEEVLPALASLRTRADSKVRILFLEASTPTLVKRYELTRRRHPLASSERGLTEAIDDERKVLEDVKAEADVVIDTSDFNVHDLRRRVTTLFAERTATGLRTSVSSFGFKHGLPIDVDLVFDCRFLPNPHWIEELRPQTGLDEPVSTYVLNEGQAKAFLKNLDDMLETLLPAYASEGKTFLSIAMGCTGGRHRSVAMAEEVAKLLRRRGMDTPVRHRDIEK